MTPLHAENIHAILAALRSTERDVVLDHLGALTRSSIATWPIPARHALARELLSLDALQPALPALGWRALLTNLCTLSSFIPPNATLPPFRDASLPTELAIRWRVLELTICETETLPDDDITVQALHRLDGGAVRHPAPLLEQLLDSPSLQIRAPAARLLREFIAAASIRGDHLVEILTSRLHSPHRDVLRLTLEQLSSAWAMAHDLGVEAHVTARSLAQHDDARVRRAAIEMLRAHFLTDQVALLWRAPSLSKQVRHDLIARAGHLLPRDALLEVFQLAIEAPEQHAAALVVCLDAMHARGVFLCEDLATELLTLFELYEEWPAREASRHAYVIRGAIYALLGQLEIEDPRWPRFLSLLPFLPHNDREALLIQSIEGSREQLTLSSALAAARAIGAPALELPALNKLPVAPRAALDALWVLGAEATNRTLAMHLLVGPLPPFLAPIAREAAALLWHISTNPTQRAALLEHLDPRALPRAIRADLGAHIKPEELELLMLEEDSPDPAALLVRLCEHGTRDVVASVRLLLAHALAELGQDHEPSASDQPWSVRTEAILPEEVERALDLLGRRLHERRCIRPTALIDAPDAHSAGKRFRAALLSDLLAPSIAPRILRVILDSLTRAAWIPDEARVRDLLRHPHPDVRKKAIALLSEHGASDNLTTTFARLASASDMQTVRQAVDALGRIGQNGATPALIEALSSPNMNIKISAARALATSGDSRALPALLSWLARHDNVGFRRQIMNALDAILQSSTELVLLDALREADTDRARHLLSEALHERVPVDTLLTLLHAQDAGAQLLLSRARQDLFSPRDEDAPLFVARYDAEDLPEQESFPTTSRWRVDAPWDAQTLIAALASEEASDIPRAWIDKHAARIVARAITERDEVAKRLVALLEQTRHVADMTPFPSASALVDALFELTARESLAHQIPIALSIVGGLASTLGLVEKEAAITRVRALPSLHGDDRLARLSTLRALQAITLPEDVRAVVKDVMESASSTAIRDALRHFYPVSLDLAHHHPEAMLTWAIDPSHPTFALDTLRAAHSDAEILATLIVASDRVDASALDDLIEGILLIRAPGITRWHERSKPRSEQTDREGAPDQEALLARALDHDDPEARAQSARLLIEQGAPQRIISPLVSAYLGGRVELTGRGPLRALGDALVRITRADRPELTTDNAQRWIDLLSQRTPHELEGFIPLLVEIWRAPGAPDAARAARSLLWRLPADVLLPTALDGVLAREPAHADLLAGSLIAREESRQLVASLIEQGEEARAMRIRELLVSGPLISKEERARLLKPLATYASPPSLKGDPAEDLPDPDALLERLDDEDEAMVRATLEVVERSARDARLLARVMAIAMTHPSLSLRSAAFRTVRRIGAREDTLVIARAFLDDPRRDVVRSAIRTLAFARDLSIVPDLVEMLSGKEALIARAAREGLLILSTAALPALARARSAARPDRRGALEDLMQQIEKSSQRAKEVPDAE